MALFVIGSAAVLGGACYLYRSYYGSALEDDPHQIPASLKPFQLPLAIEEDIDLHLQLIGKKLKTQEFEREQGIFRISGSKKRLNQVQKKLENDDPQTIDFQSLLANDSVHEVAGVLKLLIGSLHQPLIHSKTLSKLLVSEKLETLQLTKEDFFGVAHCHAFCHLISLLHFVEAHKAKNLMSASNLAVVFAPILVRLEGEDLSQSLLHIRQVANYVEFLILHPQQCPEYSVLYPKEDAPSSAALK